MSVNGAVYQPTTVSYESEHEQPPTQQRWPQTPISYIASTVSQAARRPCGISCGSVRAVLPTIYLTSAVASFTMGATMFLQGIMAYTDDAPASEAFYLSIAIIGAIVFGAGIVFVVLFLRLNRILCYRTGKTHLDGAGTQTLTVNPSTDLLVAAQYAPVSEVTYQPPIEETEQSKLMPRENKEVTDETDRMLETDPRIVLRPLHQQTVHEET